MTETEAPFRLEAEEAERIVTERAQAGERAQSAEGQAAHGEPEPDDNQGDDDQGDDQGDGVSGEELAAIFGQAHDALDQLEVPGRRPSPTALALAGEVAAPGVSRLARHFAGVQSIPYLSEGLALVTVALVFGPRVRAAFAPAPPSPALPVTAPPSSPAPSSSSPSSSPS